MKTKKKAKCLKEANYIKIVNEQNWTEDDLERLVSSGKIFYADGFERQANVLIDEYENVSDTIFVILKG